MYPKHENRNVGSAKVERELVRSSVVVHINTIKAATPLLLTRVPPPCAPKTAVLRSYLPIKQIVCLVLFHFNDFLGRFWLKKSSSFVSRKKSKNMNDHLLIFNLPMLTSCLYFSVADSLRENFLDGQNQTLFFHWFACVFVIFIVHIFNFKKEWNMSPVLFYLRNVISKQFCQTHEALWLTSTLRNAFGWIV